LAEFANELVVSQIWVRRLSILRFVKSTDRRVVGY